MTMKSVSYYYLVVHILAAILLLLPYPYYYTAAAKEDDLYKILGVSRTATTKEIKSAYRRKALDTHPDKRKDIPAEQAAEEFHKVVHAFEILTDDASRKSYDRTGRSYPNQGGTGGAGGRQQQQQYSGFTFRWNTGGGSYYRSRKLKDEFKVQEAMSRVRITQNIYRVVSFGGCLSIHTSLVVFPTFCRLCTLLV